MFSCSPSLLIEAEEKKKKAEALSKSLATDIYDDADGYYIFRRGDILNNRYFVYAKQGEGVFSTVFRVYDQENNNMELVVKLIRNRGTMHKSGLKELECLKLIEAKNGLGKKYIVHNLGHFEHKGHLCIIYEPLYKNLRQVIEKFGTVGLHISAVRHFGRQLFAALKHLKKCGILHGDIKLENILVDEEMKSLRLCDFGSAGLADEECVITPYLVSRFYRAPEIILGLKYNNKVDIWSAACVLYELFTGKILFNGDDNNHMLLLHQSIKGPFPVKMLRAGQFSSRHYDDDNITFKQLIYDEHSKRRMIKKRKILKAEKNLRYELLQHSGGEHHNLVVLLADFLDKCLQLNPTRRITIESALVHPFFTQEIDDNK